MKLASRLLLLFLIAAPGANVWAAEKRQPNDPYAKYVWPPPPDKPRIQLTAILSDRADVEGSSRFSRLLIGASPRSMYDRLRKPFGVKFDQKGRILVTDSGLGALIRFDPKARRYDVLGTTGATRLKTPLGLALTIDGTIFVADAGLGKVISFDDQGNVIAAYGSRGELTNPTGVAVSPDQKRIFVADSRAHRIVVFDIKSGERMRSFGQRGTGEGELNYPTSLSFSRQGELCVVDQLNARIVVFTETGEFVDSFGQAGTGFGNFVRPKDIALDDDGLIYVTDAAFGNVQIFASDLSLLTFVGRNGVGPGEFQIATGVATRGMEMAVVDQLNGRVQIFKFIAPKQER